MFLRTGDYPLGYEGMTDYGSCYLTPATPATPASYMSKEPPTSLPAFIDSKPARGRHAVGYVFENKCTAGTTVA